ncbi:hypothetical protein MPLSOD_240003 [Mesorhizobium sp. SOD10]|nr:hypothetical protein MPLSOD_240003 [Mesorhizobium sp. SOD10]
MAGRLAEQKKLDGDFDGDTVVIVGDRPRLYEHVRQFDQKEQARGQASLKPPKSHTPAIENGSYQFSRSRQILSATQQVLETYSCLQRNLLAQPLEAQRWFAERAVFGTYGQWGAAKRAARRHRAWRQRRRRRAVSRACRILSGGRRRQGARRAPARPLPGAHHAAARRLQPARSA